jgi:Holliday junction resolvase RusA-like endonuclease
MNSIQLKILGIPLSKQSARFKNVTMGKKTFIKSYQKQEVIDNERNIAFDVKSQLPLNFHPFDVPIGVEVLFVFSPLSSWSKKKKALLDEGAIIYKETKPDLTDNLMKGLFDALNGIVFTDDARVCKVESKKIYGLIPRIELKVYEL